MFEVKFVDSDAGELKFREDGNAPVRVQGYASIFGGLPDSYGDVIAEGAYKSSLGSIAKSGRSLPMKFEHDQTRVIGKWTTLREDSRGLFAEGELTPGHTDAANVAALLRHGAINGLSIGYKTRKADRDHKGIRTLQDIDLREISVVCNPAHGDTRIMAVKAADEITTTREFEAWLRDVGGYSRREAEAIATSGFKAAFGARDELKGGEDTDERRDDGKAGLQGLLAELKARRAA